MNPSPFTTAERTALALVFLALLVRCLAAVLWGPHLEL